MDIFIARQPIFDIKKEIYGYELLYRKNLENSFSATDGDEASATVINNLLTIGIETLLSDKKGFINFTENLLKKEAATILPKESIVVEILETVKPDKEIIQVCKSLKAQGYTIALDDFVFKEEFLPLIQLTDIIKIDFLLSSKEERKEIVKKYKHLNIKFLAEKVETCEEFEEAKQIGYSYFQGYFFSKPIILSSKNISSYKMNYTSLLKLINEIEPNFDKIAQIVEKDLSLSYELLKLINSAAFYRRNKISSIKQALTILGLTEIKKWIYLASLRKFSDEGIKEVIRTSLLRAEFCDLIGKELKLCTKCSEIYIVGMFSMLDVILNRSLKEILTDIPISKEIKKAILLEDGSYTDIYRLVLAYEKGDWQNAELLCEKLNIDQSNVFEIYCSAVKVADTLVNV